MREAFLIAIVTIGFGLGAFRLEGELGTFSMIHLGIGALCLAFAITGSMRNWRRLRSAVRLEPVARTSLTLLLVIAGAVAAERLAVASGMRFDLTFEDRYQIAPATQKALQALTGPVEFTLYYDVGDPRIRRTRVLLEEIAAVGDARIRVRTIEDSPDAEDRFGIGSSNTVIIEAAGRWASVERPTEGALYEALSSLGSRGDSIVYLTSGTGEGDIDDSSARGFSGFAVALQTEGYEVRRLPTAAMSTIPSDADAVVMLRPARRLRDDALAALDRYLDTGGNLIAFLEPGIESGVEETLTRFGLRPLDGIVVDPLSESVDGETPGLSPIAFHYSDHPAVRGLKRNRNTVFRRSRGFFLRKPRPQDKLQGLVFTSGYGWIFEGEIRAGADRFPDRPSHVREDYIPLAVAGRFRRDDSETRIVAFGDADFASNRYLRALYNLDLAMNAVGWVLEHDQKISLRPKSAGLIQFPLPVQSSLTALYSVGLLIPELTLLLGGVLWLRRRGA